VGLPENFELAGSHHLDLAWFYEVVTATVVASPGGFWLALAIPLKDVSAQFEVTKAYTFPTEVANKTYIKLHLEKPYLALNVAQNSRLDLSERDMIRCREHADFSICPADKSVLNYEIKLKHAC
jgi:hypothetical protein